MVIATASHGAPPYGAAAIFSAERSRETFGPLGAAGAASLQQPSVQLALEEVNALLLLGRPLTHQQYAWLAETAHATYLISTRDFVRSDLLVNNLSAFRDHHVHLRKGHRLDRVAPWLPQYFENLGESFQLGNDLIVTTDRIRRRVQRQIQTERTTAMQISRNLAMLRESGPLSNAEAHAVLRGYASGLALLATRAYVLLHRRPFADATIQDRLQRLLHQFSGLRFENEVAVVSLAEGDSDLDINLHARNGRWHLRCGYLAFEDLADALHFHRSRATEHFIFEVDPQTDDLRISAKNPETKFYAVFGASQLEGLRALVKSIANDMRYTALVPSLQALYGAV